MWFVIILSLTVVMLKPVYGLTIVYWSLLGRAVLWRTRWFREETEVLWRTRWFYEEPGGSVKNQVVLWITRWFCEEPEVLWRTRGTVKNLVVLRGTRGFITPYLSNSYTPVSSFITSRLNSLMGLFRTTTYLVVVTHSAQKALVWWGQKLDISPFSVCYPVHHIWPI